ncbi:MAG: DUF420 domain-containing protein [Gammaproteobacteria bacterium]|nr:DUF420 domain-containing protein [Gammaproteobacteria bacterium]
MTLNEVVPYLPHLQAALNISAATFLSAGYHFIRRRNHKAHRLCMMATFVISAVFIASYLTYHFQVGYSPFLGQGIIRPMYFSLLTSHVILATVIIPMVVATIIFAIKGNLKRHPKIARWTLPLWLYVSVSGVLIYVLNFHIYTPTG